MIVLLMIRLGKVRVAPAMKLDLLIHLSLKKGGALPPQTGDYLQDSFRQKSLIPTFSTVEEELKQLINTDGWHLMGMILISGAGALGNLLLAWKLKNLGKRISLNKEQVQGLIFIMKIFFHFPIAN